MFNNDAWLQQVQEAVVDPEREIVDPHHHLWPQPDMHYDVSEFQRDTSDGHRITQSVFMECGAAYLQDGPGHLRPVGETRFVAEAAAHSTKAPGATIAGIVAHADLTSPHLDDILDAHTDAANGLFRGIRHSGARDPNPDSLSIRGRGVERQYEDDTFRTGVAHLGERGFTYDTWHYHHQNAAFRDLAEATPETTIVLDHFGTPLGVGPYANKREEIFAAWKDDIAAIAEQPNVVAKLGGLAMPDNGFGWNNRDTPATSDEFVSAQARYYEHAIACFGPERCMFESNFPVDRLSLSYRVLWNGLKKIASKYTAAEQDLMFAGTARRVYALGAA